MLFYNIVSHEVNVSSGVGIVILAKGKTRKDQSHNKCMHI